MYDYRPAATLMPLVVWHPVELPEGYHTASRVLVRRGQLPTRRPLVHLTVAVCHTRSDVRSSAPQPRAIHGP
ncbi:hypothetical protein GCM10009610_47960 [Pseudonocardia xinjiangensis]